MDVAIWRLSDGRSGKGGSDRILWASVVTPRVWLGGR